MRAKNGQGIRLAWGYVTLLLLVGCAGQHTREDISDLLSRQFQTRYIAPYVAGDVDTWLTVFASDAVALHDGLPPLEGREAIARFGNTVARNFRIAKLDATVTDVRREGNWAWTRGQFEAVFEARSSDAPPGVAGERQGKFLLLWERDEDNQWHVIMDMGNSLASPPPP